MKLAFPIVALAALTAWPVFAKDNPMTWCAATVSGTSAREKTFYSPLFPTPDDNNLLDARFKHYVAVLAKDPHAEVAAQCIGQATPGTAAAVRKANEASDGRISDVVEVDWRP